MDDRGDRDVNDTLLDMGGSENNYLSEEGDTRRSNMVQMKRMHAESNMLSDDRTPEDPEEDRPIDNGSAQGNGLGNGDDENNSDSDSDLEEDHSQSHEPDPNTCRGKLHLKLKTNVVQYFIIALVIADCLIIVLELLIDMEFIVFPEDDPPQLHHNSHSSHPGASDSHNLTTPAYEVTDHHHNSPHHAWPDHVNVSLHNSTVNGTLGDVDHGHHHTNKQKAEHILHALSLTILSIFMVEVCLKIFVEGKHLLKQKAEVFDAIVVIVSFTLDVLFSFISVESAAKDAAGLMVLLRLWRVTRVINGVILSVKMDAKKKTDAQKKIIRQLEHDNKKQRSRIDKLEKENLLLKQKISMLNDNTSVSTNAFTQTKSNSFPEGNMQETQPSSFQGKT